MTTKTISIDAWNETMLADDGRGRTILLTNALDARLGIQCKRHATRTASEGTASVELTVTDDDRGWGVTWVAARGSGRWGKRYRHRCADRAEALAFANSKWSQCVSWLERTTPVAGMPLSFYL